MSRRYLFTTGNVMAAGPNVIRKPTMEKSNTELVNSLRENLKLASAMPETNGASTATDGSMDGTRQRPVSEWTSTGENGVSYIPSVDADQPGLLEDREEYDVTVKLFYLPGAPAHARPADTAEAVRLVCKVLHTTHLNLLIASFPSISFDAEDEDESSYEEVAEWTEAYRALESLHDAGTITRLGISEFGTTRLAQFLPYTKVKPEVDQINVRDCCVVPKPLILYAKERGIELLTHNDCTDILPTGELRALMVDEFGLCDGQQDLVPQWVVKYTAVIKSRGVVENKGYIAMAEIRQE